MAYNAKRFAPAIRSRVRETALDAELASHIGVARRCGREGQRGGVDFLT